MHAAAGTLPNETEILIVEDSRTQAEKLLYLIERKGYRARSAGNGKLALAAIAEKKPALVLSDIVMPEMNGYELCHAIKSDTRWSDIPVVLITSLTDTHDIVRGLECGADNFIRKPYADAYLLARIEQILMSRRLRLADSTENGIALYMNGKKHVIHAERQQILDLLISIYEQAVLFNEELQTRERQVSDLNAQLIRHAAELEASNLEIARQNVQLGRASQMKSEFLASMSHELRTPLNSIIGFSEVMKGGMAGQMTEQQTEFAGDILDSGKHLLSLINDILDLSKIEAGKMELELEPTDVAALLQNSLVVIKERALTHRINLNLEIDDIKSVHVDQRKTKQIVYNLLSNAVKFTPDQGTVTLRARRVDRARLQGPQLIGAGPAIVSNIPYFLEISVVDTGIGIAPDDLLRLFQPFVQLDSSLSRRYDGTGLGLALVKQLVELHGGALAVNSDVGRGSEFIVWLPYREAAPNISM
jgi:two-component system, sensor histidine kinase and response regulator